MTVTFRKAVRATQPLAGFTLAEVVIAMAVLSIVIQGVIYGYMQASWRAEWNGYSLAAQSLASQAVEQARAAQWDPLVTDELPPTNYVQIETLDLPQSGQPLFATNYVRITTVSANPPLRQIQALCVWRFASRGLFTNTMTTLRARDQ